jgi:flavodoxin/Fe-S-cluster-containing hydrogenase component 2
MPYQYNKGVGMKSVIIYFSQTGNTLRVAEAIRDAVGTVNGQCDMIRLKEADVADLVDYDLIGLGCPSFAREEPVNVKRFIRGIKPLKGKLSFVFATHGGHPGDVLPSMAGRLRRQGLKVIGGFNCDGSDRMPHFTYPWWTDGHPDKIDLEAAAAFGKEMAECGRRISRGEKIRTPKFTKVEREWAREHRKITKVNRPVSRGFEFRMTWNKEKCRYPHCRLCIDNCPVGAIDLSVSPVIFRQGCISCYFCEMLCPTCAIEYEPKSVKAQRQSRVEGLQQRNYFEFFKRANTELIGNRTTLYRRVVKEIEVGNIEGMYGELYGKRPRYIIRGRN